MKILITFTILFFIVNISAVAGNSGQIITIQQADSIIAAVVMPGVKKIRYGIYAPKDFETLNKEVNPPRFAVFSVAFEVGEGLSNYSIDIYTGDVFDSSRECFEIKNKKLEALQKKIRRSLHLTQAEYIKIKTKGPICDE